MVPVLERLLRYCRRPENVSILIAIPVAVTTGLLVELWLHWEGLGFLLVLALGVTVPTMYRQQWPGHRSAAGAAGWTLVADVVVAVVLIGVAVPLDRYADVGELVAASAGFLVVALGGPVVLYALTGEASD